MRTKAYKNKDGAALLIAIVIMVVVMMLSLALLTVSYTLYSTVSRQRTMDQCKALAQTLSMELEEEISGIPIFSSYAEQNAALNEGKYPLYFYLRCNVGQTSWPYYNTDERGHSASAASRTFTVNQNGQKFAQADELTVRIYWEDERNEFEEVWEENADGTPLVVQVTCRIGSQKSVITSTYELSLTPYSNLSGGGAAGEPDGEPDSDSTEVISDTTVNPDQNAISTLYYWDWGEADRE